MFRYFFLKPVRNRNLLNLVDSTTFRPLTSISSTNQTSFTVSYLIKSCKISQQKAISLSSKIHFETLTNPDSVLALLKHYGFTDTDIAKIVGKIPALLLSRVDRNLKPKFEYFDSIGLSGPDLVKCLSTYPSILLCSLNNRIEPSIEFLTSVGLTQPNVVTVLKRGGAGLVGMDSLKHLAPKIDLLRAHNVPDSNTIYLLLTRPRSFLQTFSRFNEIVQDIKKMDFDPSKSVFVRGIGALSAMTKATFRAKCDVYKGLGWSEDDIRRAFTKEPQCLTLSSKKITRNMDFLVNNMDFGPKLIAQCPLLLKFSTEKRIFPRYSVIRLLVSNGLLQEGYIRSTLLILPNKDFIRKYVMPFEDRVPELLDAYQGKTNGVEP